MIELRDINWEQFQMKDIFEIVDGYYNKKPPLEKNGEIPFLSATQYHNGISTFYSKESILTWDKVGKKTNDQIDRRIFEGNCITVTNNGSVGCAFFQENPFTCSHDVTPIYLKDVILNKYIALFLIPLIESSGKNYTYAKKWRPTRMRKSKILLPVDINGNPDWKFMEEYSKQTLRTKIKELIGFYKEKESSISILNKLNEIQWKTFKYDEIFKLIQRGKRLKKSDHYEGICPYVSSTSINNGVDSFIGNDTNIRLFSNCITVANSGSVGSAFFHDYDFIASDHVTVLKNEDFDKHSYLFLTTILKRLEQKYSFNREINDRRIRRERVMLPIDETGNPSWYYMTEYMRSVELSKIKRIISYLQNESQFLK